MFRILVLEMEHYRQSIPANLGVDNWIRLHSVEI